MIYKHCLTYVLSTVLGELAQDWLRVTNDEAMTGCATLTRADCTNAMIINGTDARMLRLEGRNGWEYTEQTF